MVGDELQPSELYAGGPQTCPGAFGQLTLGPAWRGNVPSGGCFGIVCWAVLRLLWLRGDAASCASLDAHGHTSDAHAMIGIVGR